MLLFSGKDLEEVVQELLVLHFKGFGHFLHSNSCWALLSSDSVCLSFSLFPNSYLKVRNIKICGLETSRQKGLMTRRSVSTGKKYMSIYVQIDEKGRSTEARAEVCE